MIRTLVIDDVRVFPRLTGTVMYVRNSTDAIKVLSNPDLVTTGTLILLDHDLGVFDDSMKIIDFLEERFHDGNPIPLCDVRVISMNPVGSQNLVKALTPLMQNNGFVRRMDLPQPCYSIDD